MNTPDPGWQDVEVPRKKALLAELEEHDPDGVQEARDLANKVNGDTSGH